MQSRFLLLCQGGLYRYVRFVLLFSASSSPSSSLYFPSPVLSPHILILFLPLPPSRQNPVPQESCTRCGNEAAAFHRRLLQGKEAFLSTSFSSPSDCGESPPSSPPPLLPCLLGVKGHSPHCPFTCSKHRVHRVAVTRRSCIYELFWDMCRVCNMHWHLSFVSHWRAQLGDVIFCCDSWGVVYLPVCHSHRRRAT